MDDIRLDKYLWAVRCGHGECGVISGAERRAVGGMAGLPPSGGVLGGG